MIVAAGAVHGQTKKHLRRRQDDVVQVVVKSLLLADRFVIPDSQSVVASRDDRVGSRWFKFVACELLFDELSVRLVLVEALDDVVAVSPDERLRAVAFVAVAFGVADQVEPVSAPAFAVLR